MYFSDHFAFRKILVQWQAVVRVKWLGDSTSPNVILGRDGWLFDGVNVGIRESGRPLTQEQIDRNKNNTCSIAGKQAELIRRQRAQGARQQTSQPSVGSGVKLPNGAL